MDPIGPRWRRLLGVLGLVAAAFLLRLHQIGRQEIWFDEADSYFLATIPTGLAHSHTPPLYFLLLRWWMTVAGTDEAAVRLLSAIFGTLFVLAVWWAGRTFFNAAVGWWSAAFSAVAPIQIYYSQEARTYALSVLLVLMAYVLLWRALERMTWRSWLLTSVVALLALYSHYVTVFALLPTALLVFLWPSSTATRRRWLAYGSATLFCGLLLFPWILWSFILTSHPLGWTSGWIGYEWRNTPPVLAIPKTLEVFALGGQEGFPRALAKSYPHVQFSLVLRLIGLGTLAGLGVWAALRRGDDRLNIPWVAKRKAWLWASLLMPLGALWLFSLYRPVYLVGRYDIIAFPAFALAVGLGMAKLQAVRRMGSLLASLLGLVLLVPIGVKLARYYDAPVSTAPWPSDRQTAEIIDAEARNGDAVILTGMRGATILYYLARKGYRWQEGNCTTGAATNRERRFACRVFPPEIEAFMGVIANAEPTPSFVLDVIDRLEDETSSVWIAFDRWSSRPDGRLIPTPRDAPLVDELERRGRRQVPVTDYDFPGIVQFR
jgi:mannosyltransferase